MTSDLHKDLSDDTETREATILDYCHRAFIIVVLKNQAMAWGQEKAAKTIAATKFVNFVKTSEAAMPNFYIKSPLFKSQSAVSK